MKYLINKYVKNDDIYGYVKDYSNSNHAVIRYLKAYSKYHGDAKSNYIDVTNNEMTQKLRRFIIKDTNLNTIDKLLLFKELDNTNRDLLLMDLLNENKLDVIEKFKECPPHMTIFLSEYMVSNVVVMSFCEKKKLYELLNTFNAYVDSIVYNLNMNFYLQDGTLTDDYMKIIDFLSKQDLDINSDLLYILYLPFEKLINCGFDNQSYISKRYYIYKFMELLPKLHKNDNGTLYIRKSILDSGNKDAMTVYYTYNDFSNLTDDALMDIIRYSWEYEHVVNFVFDYDDKYYMEDYKNVFNNFVDKNYNNFSKEQIYNIIRYSKYKFKNIDKKVLFFTKEVLNDEIKCLENYVNSVLSTTELYVTLYNFDNDKLNIEITIDDALNKILNYVKILNQSNYYYNIDDDLKQKLIDLSIKIYKYKISDKLSPSILLSYLNLTKNSLNDSTISKVLDFIEEESSSVKLATSLYRPLLNMNYMDDNNFKRIAKVFLSNKTLIPDTYNFMCWTKNLKDIDKNALKNKIKNDNNIVNIAIYIYVMDDFNMLIYYFKELYTFKHYFINNIGNQINNFIFDDDKFKKFNDYKVVNKNKIGNKTVTLENSNGDQMTMQKKHYKYYKKVKRK